MVSANIVEWTLPMLEVKKVQGSQRTIVTLGGVVDETFNLAVDLADLHSESEFFCIGVKRINSTGIKKWITYFNELKEKNYAFSFQHVSPALVEQFNLISNFGCGGPVASIALPYTCKTCGQANPIIKEKIELAGIDLENVTWPCLSCGKAELEFDDLAEEYLNFWK